MWGERRVLLLELTFALETRTDGIGSIWNIAITLAENEEKEKPHRAFKASTQQ